jgi:hypothetical protein
VSFCDLKWLVGGSEGRRKRLVEASSEREVAGGSEGRGRVVSGEQSRVRLVEGRVSFCAKMKVV